MPLPARSASRCGSRACVHPSIAAERLPKALIHRNVPGERVHAFLRALDEEWERAAGMSPFGPVQRWETALAAVREAGWPLVARARWRLGEVSVPWDAVAPSIRCPTWAERAMRPAPRDADACRLPVAERSRETTVQSDPRHAGPGVGGVQPGRDEEVDRERAHRRDQVLVAQARAGQHHRRVEPAATARSVSWAIGCSEMSSSERPQEVARTRAVRPGCRRRSDARRRHRRGRRPAARPRAGCGSRGPSTGGCARGVPARIAGGAGTARCGRSRGRSPASPASDPRTAAARVPSPARARRAAGPRGEAPG